ncbi:FAD binding domain-containing protein [Metabacillus schmidteae]|uniref:FAD binding domain-containing protein n=1 Tax=Metabacillus schmidteae TaxID=2730405 RepID=UPI00158EDA6B|nr:FAD binding domain-containing protein [Metabacillus schmidteae]
MNSEYAGSILKSEMIVKHPIFIKDALIHKKGQKDLFVAGGTLLQVQWESGTPLPNTLINLLLLQELRGVTCQTEGDSSRVTIGALTTIAECISHPIIAEHVSLLSKACRTIAAPAVRNRATIGGNVASLAGDTIPALLALNAEVKLALENDIYVMSLRDWLANPNQQQSCILLEIMIPVSSKGTTNDFYRKVGRREAFIPSLLTIGGQWELNNKGEIQFVRIAVGGGSHRPIRLERVETILRGKTVNQEILYKAIVEEFQSYSDPFVSETYRKKVAVNIIMSEFSEVLGGKG